ncbi:DDT domain-containing protein PTM-like isoform X2 [Phalaenopsis equestris]|uniref:DDT domain-containing protein PTM-like isoform X2 n=1 Tax=Phalaenopsis equestris TaxID=78828 RepID=UPI0009E594CB|nr:DDT domain-containing protein PTM-like isoform X2 [Phalaenopsis equestris]
MEGSRENWRKEGEEEMVCTGTETSGSGRWDCDGIAGGGGGGGGDVDGGLIGAYVERNSFGVGRVLLGKVVSYDGTSRLYRVIFEDGHMEDLERELVCGMLMLDKGVGRLTRRKRRLDRIVPLGGLNRRSTRSRKDTSDVPASIGQVSSEDVFRDADSSSDSCDHAGVSAAAPSSTSVEAHILPLELPPSSGDIAVLEGSVSHLFSTYNFLRSFSLQLFLSPFGFDDYVGSLNCTVQNSLMDSIHLSLMRALGRHLQMVSSEGPNLASKCLRLYDWTLLDMLTWPSFVVEYLYVMGYVTEFDSKEFIDSVLHGEYYCLTVATKLKVLQLLCDDVINSGELRTELGMRVGVEEDNEEGLDEDVPTSLRFKTSKNSSWKDSVVLRESLVLENQHVNTDVSELGVDGSANSQDKNSDECCLCGMDGTLICCDGCPSAYHSRCIGLNKAFLPEGLWFCPECSINKLGATSSRIGKGARGAEVFGADSYGRMFVGTCNYLLVYYNQDDIPKVLSVISTTQANALDYVDISIGIAEYFEVPMGFLSAERVDYSGDTPANKDDTVCYSNTLPRTMKTLNNSGENSVSNIMAQKLKHSVAKNDVTDDPTSPSVVGQVDISGALITLMESHDVCANKLLTTPDEILVFSNNENPTNGIVLRTDPKVLISKPIERREKPGFGSVVTDLSYSNPAMPTEKSNIVSNFAFSSGNGSDICKEDAYSSIYSTKNGSAGMCYESRHKNSNDRASAVPVSFKPLSYINQYIQGDIAASAAATLAVLLMNDSKVAGVNGSSNQRKFVAATIAVQMKAFSVAVMNFLWPCAGERCGWCIACKGPTTNKKGCLLNLAASNAIKGPTRNGNLRASKHHESHLPVIAAHLLIMEESLRGLMVGPFLDECSNQWRMQVREASSCSFLKSLILQLEENIRGIAFSGGWTKFMDDMIEMPKSSSGLCRIGGNKKRGSGIKRGRRQAELPIASSDDTCDYLQWWRGGELSKAIFQTAKIPSSLAKKAARQAGRRRIPGISYHECSAYRRRSRQVAWRAAVESSKCTSQLALQVRYLDAHIRWKEFSRPEQIPIDIKGSENDIIVFRNTSISDKKIVEDKILYALNFGDQKHIPSRIAKTVVESEKAQGGNEKLWFSECHLPLYLIKEYEEKVGKCQVLLAVSSAHNMAIFYRRALKPYWGDVFTYLTCRSENPVKCSFCQKAVFLRYAVKCKACEDYCHLHCSVASVAKKDDDPMFSKMCKSCYSAIGPTHESSWRTCSMKSSLLGNYQQLAMPLTNGIIQTRAVTSLSVSKMEVNSDSRSSNHTPNSKSKTKRKGGTWLTHGIVWKRKKHGPEGGKEFRMENILLKVKEGSYSSKSPICCLCKMPYNSNLMYVCCGTCKNWCHADAVLLDESKVLDVVGFKCCKCRRKSSPKCPYSEIGYIKLEEQLKHDSAAEIGVTKSGSPSTSISNSETDNFGVVEFDPSLHSIEKVEPLDETNLEMEHKFDASIETLKDQQKVFIKSQVKLEDFDEWYAGQIGFSMHETSQSLQNIPAQNTMSDSWNIPGSSEWDSIEIYGRGNIDFKNECKEGHLPDQELEAAKNMEFEPQTYFSFTELLASADDMTGDMMEPQDVPVTLSDYGTTYSDRTCHNLSVKNEITVKEEFIFDEFECEKCKLCIPSPDLICEICGLCIHSHCSPWVEEVIEISTGSKWRCGNCREWR